MRYPEGTQICRKTITLHSKYYQKDIPWTLPVRFFDENIIVFTELNDKNIVDIQKVINQEGQIIILLDQLENKSKII